MVYRIVSSMQAIPIQKDHEEMTNYVTKEIQDNNASKTTKIKELSQLRTSNVTLA